MRAAEGRFAPESKGATMLPLSRIATLAAFVFIAGIVSFAIVDRARVGEPAATLVSDGPASNSLFVVRSAPAGGALRVGDRVAIDDPGTLAAFEYHAFAVGSELHVRRISPDPESDVAVPIRTIAGRRFTVVVVAITALFLGVAFVVAARGRSAGSLQLAWLLALIVLLMNPTAPAWPSWLILLYAVIGGWIATLVLGVAADFASRFASEPDANWSRRYRVVAWSIAIVAGVSNVAESAYTFFSPRSPAAFQYLEIGGILVQVSVFLVGLGIAYRRAPEADRQKVMWVVVSLAAGIVGLVTAVLAEAAGVKEPLRDVPLLLLIAMPLGCAYAILRYRLLDIGFVVNRATVFGVTSLVVLGALALVDFGLQNLLGSWLVRTGLYVQLALALSIGIATRPLHGRVDRFVDDLFFRQRHEAERTLRQFVRDVPHIDDPGVVARRTVEIVARTANLGCTLLLATERGDYVRSAASDGSIDVGDDVDRNDGTPVRLLATRAPVDLHDVGTRVVGDFAFPMFARDRLIGILVCGGKRDGVAAYAPDELDAIADVARASGLALDLLRVEALERELVTLRARFPAGSPS